MKKCYNTYYYHNIFTIVKISVSYISNKKMANPQYLTLISQQIMGKLLLMDSTGATVLLVYSTATVPKVFFFFEIFM